MKKFLGFALLVSCFLFLVSSVKADTGQYGQYGQPSVSYQILIDKMVTKPDTDQYVDNLSVSDPRFAPNQDIWFQIKVKNTSNQDLTNVEVHDYVPSYLEPLEGPGTWDSNTRVISWNAGDFVVDEEKVYFLKMRVYSTANLPSDKGLFCLVNKTDARNENTYDEDTAQFCIEKEVVGVSKVPSAGPEFGLLLLAGNILGAGAGLYIKKKF